MLSSRTLGKITFLILCFWLSCMHSAKAESHLQAYVYMAGNGAGGGNTIALDESNMPLQVSCTLQFIWAGTNDTIDPPAMNNPPYYLGGDDVIQDDPVLLNCTQIGDDYLDFGCTNNGEFSGVITGPDLGDVTYGRKAYVRAWNASTIENATKYGDCERVTVSIGPSDPVEISQLKTSLDLPVPPHLGYVSPGLLSSGTYWNTAAGRADFSFRVNDADGSTDYAWYSPGSASYSIDNGSNWNAIADSDIIFYTSQFVPATNWAGMLYTVSWNSRAQLPNMSTNALFRFRVFGKDGPSEYAVSPPVYIDNASAWLDIVETSPYTIEPGTISRVIWHASTDGAYEILCENTDNEVIRSGQYTEGTYVTNYFSTATGLQPGLNTLTVYLTDAPSPSDTTWIDVQNSGDIWSFITNPLDGSVAPRYDALVGRAYADYLTISDVEVTLYDTELNKYFNGVEFVSPVPYWLPCTHESLYSGVEFICNTEFVPWRNGVTYRAQSRAHAASGVTEIPEEFVYFTIDSDAALFSIVRAYPRVVGSLDGAVEWISDTASSFELRANDPVTGELLASGTTEANVTNETQFICANLPLGTNTLYLTASNGGHAGFTLVRIEDMTPISQVSTKNFTCISADDDGDMIEFTYTGHPESTINFNGRIIYIETVDGNGNVKMKVTPGINGDGVADIIGIWCNNGLKSINTKGINLGQFHLNSPPFIRAGGGGVRKIQLKNGCIGMCPHYGHITDIMDSPDTASEAAFVKTLKTKGGSPGKDFDYVRGDILSSINIGGELKSLICGGGDIGVTQINCRIHANSIDKVIVKGSPYKIIEDNVKTKAFAGGNLMSDILVHRGAVSKVQLKGGNFMHRRIHCAGSIKKVAVKATGGIEPVGGKMIGATICAGADPSTLQTYTAEIKNVFVHRGMQAAGSNYCVIASGVFSADEDYEGRGSSGNIMKLKVKEGNAEAIVASKNPVQKLQVPSAQDLIIYINGDKQ